MKNQCHHWLSANGNGNESNRRDCELWPLIDCLSPRRALNERRWATYLLRGSTGTNPSKQPTTHSRASSKKELISCQFVTWLQFDIKSVQVGNWTSSSSLRCCHSIFRSSPCHLLEGWFLSFKVNWRHWLRPIGGSRASQQFSKLNNIYTIL